MHIMSDIPNINMSFAIIAYRKIENNQLHNHHIVRRKNNL